jgi:acetyltransferase-like isoleucine patch superfamily enzyme
MMFDNAENPNKVSIMNKFNQMRVMIFGANDDGRDLFYQLKPLILIKAIDVIAFIDNDSRLIGREIEGKKIIFPEQVTDYEYDLIVVAPIFFAEILRQLIDLGVSEDRIIPYLEDHTRNFGDMDREFDDVKIGKYSYYKRGTKLMNCNIGRFCHIGDNCAIGLFGHDTSQVTTYPLKYHFDNSVVDVSQDSTADAVRKSRQTIIKNDVYIGESVTIFAGVTVGNGAVIGARAVVTKDVPDYAVVAGVPSNRQDAIFWQNC